MIENEDLQKEKKKDNRFEAEKTFEKQKEGERKSERLEREVIHKSMIF